jgi:VanZ family protein
VDKVVHLFLYAVLGALALRSASSKGLDLHTCVWAFVCVVAFGALDEAHQALLPMRTASVADFLADATGGALGVAAAAVAAARRARAS